MFIQTTNVLVFMLQCKQYLKIMRNGNVTPFSSSSVFTSFCGGLEYFSGALYVEFPICRYIHSLICAQNSNQYQLDTTKIKTDNAVNTEYSVLRCVFKDFFPPPARPHYSRDNFINVPKRSSLPNWIQSCKYNTIVYSPIS